MGTKLSPGKYDCYANADPHEPMFILLGRDPHAHQAVRKWARDREALINAGLKPTEDRGLVAEALDCADQMQAFAELRARTKMTDAQTAKAAVDLSYENLMKVAAEKFEPGCVTWVSNDTPHHNECKLYDRNREPGTRGYCTCGADRVRPK